MKRADRKKHIRRVSRPAKKQPDSRPIPKETKGRALTIAADLSQKIGVSAIEFVPQSTRSDQTRGMPDGTRATRSSGWPAALTPSGFIGALVIDDTNGLLAGLTLV